MSWWSSLLLQYLRMNFDRHSTSTGYSGAVRKNLFHHFFAPFFSFSLSLFLTALSDELCCIKLCQGLLVQYLIWRKREERRKIALNLEMQPREREREWKFEDIRQWRGKRASLSPSFSLSFHSASALLNPRHISTQSLNRRRRRRRRRRKENGRLSHFFYSNDQSCRWSDDRFLYLPSFSLSRSLKYRFKVYIVLCSIWSMPSLRLLLAEC